MTLWEKKIVKRDEKYLGNPLFFTSSNRKDFRFLKKKVIKRLEGWKSKLLSKARRTTFMRTMIQSVSTYTLFTFKVSVSICRAINMAVRMFWWVGNLEKKRFMAFKP